MSDPKFYPARNESIQIVIASGAKQSIFPAEKMDCFGRFCGLAMTGR